MVKRAFLYEIAIAVTPFHLLQHAIDFWCRPIQGLNFENLREMALSEPEIGFVTPETVVTEEAFLARY